MNPGVVTLTGDPGAGKSTLAQALAGALGPRVQIWSAGRAAAQAAPDLVARGEWGPEEAVRQSLREALEGASLSGGFLILDGWPRRPGQAAFLSSELRRLGGYWAVAVVLLAAPEEVLARYRTAGAVVCRGCGERHSEPLCPRCGSGLHEGLDLWYTRRRRRQMKDLEAAVSELVGAGAGGPPVVVGFTGPRGAESTTFRALRQAVGLSQAELALRAGVNFLVIHHADTGKSIPGPKTIFRVARALADAGAEVATPPGEERLAAIVLELVREAAAREEERRTRRR